MKNIFVLLFLLLPLPLYAQAPTNLKADNIFYNETSGDIEATGDVVAIQGHMILRTEKLIYDASSDSILIPGSLFVKNCYQQTHGN